MPGMRAKKPHNPEFGDPIRHSLSGFPIYAEDAKRRPVYGYNENDRPVCYSPRINDRPPCMALARMANGRCKVHGGKSLRGKEHPNYIDGRSVKSQRRMPQYLQVKYEEALADTDLLSLRDNIAFIRAQIIHEIEMLTSAGAAESFAKITKKWGKFVDAIARRDTRRQSNLVTEIDGMITAAQDDQSRWSEILVLMEQERRLIKDERDHMLKSDMMVTMEQVWHLQAMQLEFQSRILLQHVDSDTAVAILRSFSANARQQVLPPISE